MIKYRAMVSTDQLNMFPAKGGVWSLVQQTNHHHCDAERGQGLWSASSGDLLSYM